MEWWGLHGVFKVKSAYYYMEWWGLHGVFKVRVHIIIWSGGDYMEFLKSECILLYGVVGTTWSF